MVGWVLCGFVDGGWLIWVLIAGHCCWVFLFMILFYLLVGYCVSPIGLYCLIHLGGFLFCYFCLRFDLVCLAFFVLIFVVLYLVAL